MKFIENEITELKEMFTKDIKKGIVAFANTKGGKVYIGVKDDGTIVGVNEPDKTILQVISMIRDSIRPDLIPFISSELLEHEGKYIIVINVTRGTNTPYYIADKGLKPSGVYTRQGNASAPVSESAIRTMIKETDGDSFEKERSLENELTFQIAKKEFKKRKLEFNDSQMKTLGLIKENDIYTNLALLISEQCKHAIKVAVFYGNDKMKFKDRREFTGSIFEQLNKVYEYIDLLNKTNSEIEGLRRRDTRDYPEWAIREALINAIVHRDYSFSGSTLISIFDDKIEIVSIGGLFGGITMEDVAMGVSQARNEKLSAIFYRLELIEAYGTGIAKIMKSYKNSIRKPEIKVTDNAFKITLPKNNNTSLSNESDKEKAIIDYLAQNEEITRKEVENILGIGQTMAGRILKDLMQSKQIMKVGKGGNTKYIVNNG